MIGIRGMAKTRVYVAGPMTGCEGFNHKLFNYVAAQLRLRGFEVVNPAEIGNMVAPAEELAADVRLMNLVVCRELAELRRCDAICLLPGWQNSPGTKQELHQALEDGLDVMLWKDGKELT